MNEGKLLCQRTIVNKSWTGHSKRKCGRVATRKQADGLPLCERHFNRLMRKLNKAAEENRT